MRVCLDQICNNMEPFVAHKLTACHPFAGGEAAVLAAGLAA